MSIERRLIKIFGFVLAVALLFAMLPVGGVKANDIASAEIVFESQPGYTLTENPDGTYSGVIPAKVGWGFDIFAKEGVDAYFDDAAQLIGADHDAWPTWTPDTPDWYQYSLELYEDSGVQKWALRNHAGATEVDPWYTTATAPMGVPMSGSMHWGTMYAEETDVGAYLPGTGTAKYPGKAASHGGGAGYWDMDWSWGSEAVPLEYPGFEVSIEDLGSGNYRVTLTPAEGPVKNLTTNATYATIQAAIDGAGDGDTILVEPGTYPEEIILRTPNITVQSTGGAEVTIIDSPLGDLTSGVWALSGMGSLTFDGFTVQNFTENGIVQSMGNHDGTEFHVLNNIVIPYNGYLRNGIQVSGDGSTVIGNTINGAPLTDSWASSAIMVVNSSNTEVSSNTIVGGTLGVDIGISIMNYSGVVDNILVANNTTTDAGNGIRLSANASATLMTNVTITGNDFGYGDRGFNAQTITVDTVSITGNNFHDNSSAGLRFSSSSATVTNATITGNTFTNNATQIYGGTMSEVEFAPVLGSNTFDKAVTTTNWPVDIYSMIQTGIDESLAGDTVHAAAGAYEENVTIDKQVNVIGAGMGLTILSAPTFPVITVSANDVYIEGVGITDPVALDEAIRVDGATANLTLQDIAITNLIPTVGNAEGVNFLGSFDGFTANNLNVYGADPGAYTRGIGVFLSKPDIASNFSITNSTFENLFVGVYINGYLDGVSIQNNVFGPMDINDCQAAAAGIYFGDGPTLYTVNDLTVSGNLFMSYCRGLYVWDYADDGLITNVTVDHNTFLNSIYSSGIRFIADWWTDASHATILEGPLNITNNIFIQDEKIINGDGVSLIDLRLTGESPTSQINITGNSLSFSGTFDVSNYGLLVRGPLTNLTFADNTFSGGDVGGASVDLPPTTGVLLGTDHSYWGPISSSANLDISGNTITGFLNGVGIYDFNTMTYGNLPAGAVVSLEENQILGNGVDINYGAGEEVDASPNWWGSVVGPVDGKVIGNINFAPWCGDEDCLTFMPNAEGEIVLPPDVTEEEIQTAIDNAPSGSTVVIPAGSYTVTGGFVVNSSGVTIFLSNGAHIENNSPCFVINADYTTINAETPLGAVCVPTSGSNGIDVAAGLTNIVIEGLEIDGSTTGGTEADGIHFAGVVTDLNIADLYIHDMPDAGLFFAAEPAGVVQIQGNLFMTNGGNGIEAGAFVVPAEYNAWGSEGGPSTGDGVSPFVNFTPWTHVDLYMESDLTDYPNSVYLGEDITFDVFGNLVNVMGVDVTVEFPAELTYLDDALPGLFDYEEIEVLGNTVHFVGYQISSSALNVPDQILFSMAFEGNTVGTDLILDLDEDSDVFSMFAGAGSISTNIYAACLSDITDIEVNAYPTVEIVPSSGLTYVGIPDEFTVEIDNTDGDDLASVGLSFDLPAGASLEYYVSGTGWVPFVDLTDLGALASDGSLVVEFRITFDTTGPNDITVYLFDLTPDPDTLLASDYETFTALGDFTVSGTVAMQGRTVRSGVPMTLTDVSGGYVDNEITSTFEISDNYAFMNVNAGIYQFTTNQPRYLNVSLELDRLLDINDDYVLSNLELKGGNAVWTDNVIDLSDASAVGALYGIGSIVDNADVNFDDRVNIQDLALVGGNYTLTSEVAYADWPTAEHPEVFGTFEFDNHTGAFTAEMYGAYDFSMTGFGVPAGPNLTTFSGPIVSGDYAGCAIDGTINAMGMDFLYAEITCTSVYTARLYGTLMGNFAGWLATDAPLAPVGTVTVVGDASVSVGNTIDLDVLLDGVAPDRPVRWAIYVNDRDFAEIDMLTGELTGLMAGDAIVIVTVLDDSNLSYNSTFHVTVNP